MSWTQSFLLHVTDWVYTVLPQPVPDLEKLQHCKIVSHRGEHDNKTVFENTIPAFDRALEAGVWGIELDIRWTKDLHPIVSHDPDCQRIFKKNVVISQVTLQELKSKVPLIPTFKEVIEKYSKKLHFMLEIKNEEYSNPNYQSQLLQSLLGHLTPQEDFHFISLDVDLFGLVEFVPKPALLPVSELNYKKISKIALDQEYGGVTGHFLLLSKAILQKHNREHQKIGTGFIRSKNCLFREINKGVNWIFTNDAIKLQKIIDKLTS